MYDLRIIPLIGNFYISDLLSLRMTGAKHILLFYNFLPNKKLTIKPNKGNKSCVQPETLSQDIIQATKRLVLRHQRTETAQSGVTLSSSQLSERVEQLSQDNRVLLGKVDSLQQSIDLLVENLNKQHKLP